MFNVNCCTLPHVSFILLYLFICVLHSCVFFVFCLVVFTFFVFFACFFPDSFRKTGSGTRTSSLSSDYQEIQKVLTDREPAFILSRAQALPSSSPTSTPATDYDSNLWQLIFYMPENAMVRDRMVCLCLCFV